MNCKRGGSGIPQKASGIARCSMRCSKGVGRCSPRLADTVTGGELEDWGLARGAGDRK